MPTETWWELRVRGVPRAHIDRVSARLFAAGAAGLQEDLPPGVPARLHQLWDRGPRPAPAPLVWLRAYFEDPDRSALAEELADLEATWVAVADEDWEARARARFPPLEIGGGLVIAAPWDAPPGALIIEPGSAYGTGHHESTRAALQGVLRHARRGVSVLDVGCGSGILALAAARLGADARGVDNDPVAVAEARANAWRNGLQVPFDTTAISELQAPAELVVANLHAELIASLASDLARLTARTLVLAGVLASRAEVVAEALAPLPLELRRSDPSGEWLSLELERA